MNRAAKKQAAAPKPITVDDARYNTWNRKDRIDQAKAEWRAGKFDSVPGESEFIPLPE
mgnify:CR=1 FL=1